MGIESSVTASGGIAPGGTIPNPIGTTSLDGGHVAIGATTDAEAAAGNGTIVALLKRHRTLLTTISVLLGAGLPAALVAGRLDVSLGAFNASLPTGTNHIGRVALDSLLDSLVSVVGGRLDSMRRLDTVRYIPRIGGQDSVRRVDSLRFGRVADSLFSWLGSTAPTVGQKAMASSLPVTIASDQTRVTVKVDTSAFSPSYTSGNFSIGTSTGKSAILKTGSITSTAATADQVILTYTVTGGKTLYLEYFCLQARLTTQSTTGSILGAASWETPSGTKVYTASFANPTIEDPDGPWCAPMSEPIPIAAGVVLRAVTTPTAVTSMLWIANFGGYEK